MQFTSLAFLAAFVGLAVATPVVQNVGPGGPGDQLESRQSVCVKSSIVTYFHQPPFTQTLPLPSPLWNPFKLISNL